MEVFKLKHERSYVILDIASLKTCCSSVNCDENVTLTVHAQWQSASSF